MHVKAGTAGAERIKIMVDGTQLGTVCEADSDEGWVEQYAVEDVGGELRVVVDSVKGKTVTVRVHRYFELVDRATGEILAVSSSPRIKTGQQS